MPVRLVLLALTTALLSACGASSAGGEEAASGQSNSRSEATPAPTTPTATGAGNPSAAGAVRLQISAGGIDLVATLRDSQAARDLLAQLPLTLRMKDHGDVEKTGPLPRRLSVADEPAGADPDVADLGYYAPGNDLVLYYGDQSYYDGIVILGRLDGNVRGLRELAGDVNLQVRRL